MAGFFRLGGGHPSQMMDGLVWRDLAPGHILCRIETPTVQPPHMTPKYLDIL